MKTLAFELTFAVAALLASTSAAHAVGVDDIDCNGTLVGIINGSVNVGRGATCTIGSTNEGAYILGNVQVGRGASLIVQARQHPSTITGDVQAEYCEVAQLQGAVTVGGNVQIQQCQQESGFNGPGIKISGNFQCQNNWAPCDATIGVVGGNAQITNNTGAGANVSLNEIHGNLDCQNDETKPSAAWGANWVSGNLQNDCAANLGFAWPATPPTCTQLQTALAKVPYIISKTTVNDNVAYNPVASAVVAGTASNPSYCNVQLTYSAIGSPGSSAPLTSVSYGYGTNENQAIKIGIGLPLNAADFTACSAHCGTAGVQGAWNGRLQNLGGGGLAGSVGSTTAATNAGYVGSSTDTGHTSAQNGTTEGDGNWGVTGTYSPANPDVPTTPNNFVDAGKISDFLPESIHEQVEWSKLLSRIYYGQKWAYNYWNGCSTGGLQGMTLAMNYGDEFDGIVAGAPAVWSDRFRFSSIWPYLVNQDDLINNGNAGLTAGQVSATAAVEIQACQQNNASGAVDYLQDPRQCSVSASTNICGATTVIGSTTVTAAASPNCLTAVQAQAWDKIRNGTHNAQGYRVAFTHSKGVTTETLTAGDTSGNEQVLSWIHGSTSEKNTNVYENAPIAPLSGPVPVGAQFYDREMLAGATPADLETPPVAGRDNVSDDDLLDGISPYFGVRGINLDLVLNPPGVGGAGRTGSGKILSWQGGADQMIINKNSIDFYRQVAVHYSGNGTANFGTANGAGGTGLQSWYRYYIAPGALHCATGVGGSPTNTIFQQLVNWVENNAAPDPLPAPGGSASTDPAQPSNATYPVATYPWEPPLCPWPTTAHYGGGPGNAVSSFYCAGNLDSGAATPSGSPQNYALCQMLRTPEGQETSNTLDYAETGITPAQCPAPQ